MHGMGWLILAAFLIAVLGWMRHQKQRTADVEQDAARTFHPYRLDVKLATDPAARQIQVTRATSIAALLALPPGAGGARTGPLETNRWALTATVTGIEASPDGDLVLQVEQGAARTTAESPDPGLCAGSPFVEEIRGAREQIRRHPKLPCRAEVIGIGFAGLPGKDNPTGIRLYPVLSIRWLSGSAR